MALVKASRKRVYIKIALTGPSGSGKTYSGLQVARGLAGPSGMIGVIDTENGSASLYADTVEFFEPSVPVNAPFTVDKYINALGELIEGGCTVILIDSLSHEWSGEGGLLAQKEARDARGGNNFANWAPVTKEHEKFKSAILDSPVHVIGTMRSKQEYAQTGDGGKTKIQKLGAAPIQREGMEYEFSTVFDIAMNHEGAVSKDRTGLFDGYCGLLGVSQGKALREWLATGGEPVPVATEQKAPVRLVKDAYPDFVKQSALLNAHAQNKQAAVALLGKIAQWAQFSVDLDSSVVWDAGTQHMEGYLRSLSTAPQTVGDVAREKAGVSRPAPTTAADVDADDMADPFAETTITPNTSAIAGGL